MTAPANDSDEVARWFAAVARALDAADATSPDSDVDGEERRLLLDLARIAAHGAVRWAAPITTYVVGRALADRSDEERLAVLRALVDALDAPGSTIAPGTPDAPDG